MFSFQLPANTSVSCRHGCISFVKSRSIQQRKRETGGGVGREREQIRLPKKTQQAYSCIYDRAWAGYITAALVQTRWPARYGNAPSRIPSTPTVNDSFFRAWLAVAGTRGRGRSPRAALSVVRHALRLCVHFRYRPIKYNGVATKNVTCPERHVYTAGSATSGLTSLNSATSQPMAWRLGGGIGGNSRSFQNWGPSCSSERF